MTLNSTKQLSNNSKTKQSRDARSLVAEALGNMSEESNAIEYCKITGNRAILVYVSEPIESTLKGSIETKLKALGVVRAMSIDDVATQKIKTRPLKRG